MNQNTAFVLVVLIICIMFGYVATQTRPTTDFELRLINLEELHTVNSHQGRVYLEHSAVPTSCSTQYTNVPMIEWVKYEHLLGR